MNWDAIAAIAELLAALGVIGSLIYLATQIRQNSQSVKSESVRQLLGQSSDLFLGTIGSPELISAMSAATPGNAAQNADEMRLTMIAAAVFTNFENGFYQYQSGSLPEEIHEAYRRRISDFLNTPFAVSYWETFSHRFTDSFRDHVNEIKAAKRAEG